MILVVDDRTTLNSVSTTKHSWRVRNEAAAKKATRATIATIATRASRVADPTTVMILVVNDRTTLNSVSTTKHSWRVKNEAAAKKATKDSDDESVESSGSDDSDDSRRRRSDDFKLSLDNKAFLARQKRSSSEESDESEIATIATRASRVADPTTVMILVVDDRTTLNSVSTTKHSWRVRNEAAAKKATRATIAIATRASRVAGPTTVMILVVGRSDDFKLSLDNNAFSETKQQRRKRRER